jgi:hypothetical protein
MDALTLLKRQWMAKGKSWINPADHDLPEDVFKGLKDGLYIKGRWRGRIRNRFVDSEGNLVSHSKGNKRHHTEFMFEIEYGYGICNKCLDLLPSNDLHEKQCVYCNEYLPMIISRELQDKYRRYQFGEKLWFGISNAYSGCNALKANISTSPCAGGAWSGAGSIEFDKVGILVKTRTAWSIMRHQSDKHEEARFEYAQPNCFDLLHDYFRRITINHQRVRGLEHRRSWQKHARELKKLKD